MTSSLSVCPPDHRLDQVENFLRSIPDIEQKLLEGVARAIDEVVDPVRSARWTFADLAQPEKTVFGIRVENVLRMELGLERSTKFDVRIGNEDVDIKFTIYTNWAIPPEAHGEICLVAKFRERDHTVSVGLVRATSNVLNPGKNRDSKVGLNKLGKSHIRWLIKDMVADSSIIGFMARLPPQLRIEITDSHVGAQIRQNRLFLSLLNQPIPEALVEAISQHRDWTRRLRPDAANPRAPGKLSGNTYDVLRHSSANDRNRLKAAGLPPLKPGFCMSVDPMAVPKELVV